MAGEDPNGIFRHSYDWEFGEAIRGISAKS